MDFASISLTPKAPSVHMRSKYGSRWRATTAQGLPNVRGRDPLIAASSAAATLFRGDMFQSHV
jgi:hypothetical protein